MPDQNDQIRSADLLVKTALSSPETMDALKTDPAGTLKKLGAQAVSQLPRLVLPTPRANDTIWLVVVVSFAVVMVGAVVVLGIGVFSNMADGKTQITRSDTMLTVFTTVVGFLAGLLAPSPVGQRGGQSSS